MNNFERITIVVTAWNNGQQNPNGTGYGIRVGKRNRHLFNELVNFNLSIEEGEYFSVNITNGFWNQCPEFRSTEIGIWFRNNNLAPWTHGNPPSFYLTKLNENHFRLDREI